MTQSNSGISGGRVVLSSAWIIIVHDSYYTTLIYLHGFFVADQIYIALQLQSCVLQE